jgi:hypothetical protein
MPARFEIAPYRQGQLDGLCGLYAVINALRLATHDRTGEFGDDLWKDLLLTLLCEAEGMVGTATAVVHGIGARPLYALARLGARHMAVEHNVAVTISRGLNVDRHSFCVNVARLAELTERPRTAVIIELSGAWIVLATAVRCRGYGQLFRILRDS